VIRYTESLESNRYAEKVESSRYRKARSDRVVIDRGTQNAEFFFANIILEIKG
tara:strand:+ start:647 stop:805 length:159 start_codon:yes stop_codon:yes gene_type:complete